MPSRLIRSKLVDRFRDTLEVTGVSKEDTLSLPVKYFHSTQLLSVGLGVAPRDVFVNAPSVKFSSYCVMSFYLDIPGENECDIAIGNMMPLSSLKKLCNLGPYATRKILDYHRLVHPGEIFDFAHGMKKKITLIPYNLPMMRTLFFDEISECEMPFKVRKR